MLYCVLRWQSLLYGEITGKVKEPLTPPTPEQELEYRATTFEREIQIYRNTVAKLKQWRDYLRTDAGLRRKRDISIGLVMLVLTGYQIWQYVLFNRFEAWRTLDQFFFLVCFVGWFFVLYLAIQIVFYRLISRGITLSENESKAEQLDFGDWTAESVSPERRRHFIKSAALLLFLGPVLIFLLAIFVNYAQINQFFRLPPPSPPQNAYHVSQVPVGGADFRSIYVSTVLAVVMAFWGTIRPQYRNRIYAIFFLGIGIWMFVALEWNPFLYSGWGRPILGFMCSWMNQGEVSIPDTITYGYFYWHFYAGSCLAIYTAFAIFCGLSRRKM